MSVAPTARGTGWLERRWLPLLGAVLLTFVLWCAYYRSWPGTPAFQVPIAYANRGDVLYTLGVTKAFAELPRPWNLQIAHLNAPFGADWNDYPHTEKLIFYTLGLLRRVFDAGVTANVGMLLSSLAAAFSFAWAAGRLGVGAVASAVGAVLFTLSPFQIGRGLGHFNIAVVWHIPLLLVLIRSIAMGSKPSSALSRWAGVALLVATALLNPYYTILSLQLLALATLRAWLRGEKAAARHGAEVVIAGGLTFALNQANVLVHARVAGPNMLFSGRNMGAILNWGLRLPDLLLPSDHPIKAWSDFAHAHYFGAGNPGSENGFAFLGIVGCTLFLALVATAVKRGLAGQLDEVPWQAWVIGYTVLFGLAGGLVYLLGALGMTWLRACNRYSIVILCAVLLWGGQALQRFRRPPVRVLVSSGALTLAIFELFGCRPANAEQESRNVDAMARSDREFARELERELPPGGAVFELPVAGFPESPAIADMADYEQFRTYLWTSSLRFSYGTHKGREREDWQTYAQGLKPAELVDYLEQHGFDAVQVNRRGYADRGLEIETALQALTGGHLVSPHGDLSAFRLNRRAQHLPTEYPSIALQKGFPWGWERRDESRQAWSNGSAELRFSRPLKPRGRYHLSFMAGTLVDRPLTVRINEKRVASTRLIAGKRVGVAFDWVASEPYPRLRLDTDDVARPTNGDSRILGFVVADPEVRLAGAAGREK